MKRLNILATILCLTIFINGCQKDSIIDNIQIENQLQNTDIELRDYDEETCGDNISELCVRCQIPVVSNLPIRRTVDMGGQNLNAGSLSQLGTGTIGVYDPCSGATISALVLKYQEVLGMNDPHTNAEQIIEDAVNANIPSGFNPKTDCLNAQDIVESILNDPIIAGSPYAQFLIKLNYLDVLLSLKESEYTQLQSVDNQNFVDMLYAELNETGATLACQDADCSFKQAVESLIGFHLYSGETVLQEDIDNTKDFYQYLYCQNNNLLRATNRLEACGQQYITLFLRDNLLSYSDLETLLEKYYEAWSVYYGNAYGPAGFMGQRLQQQGVSWCDMIEITNVMYENALGLPTFAPDAAEGFTDAAAGPVLLLLKGLGEGFGDALAQAFFIWIADNDKDGFAEAIPCINPFESAVAFFKGLIPWKATTNQQIAAHLTVDAAAAMIVVMDRAIKQDNYTWEQAGIDYATTFAAYVAGDILGAGFAKYGVPLAKGVAKKFDPFINPNGFFGITFTYKRICKWFGGGLKNGNFYNLPTCNTCFYNGITMQFEPVTMVRGMEGWKVLDEVYLIGRSQPRVNGYKDFLNTQNVGFTVKTINDDIPSANWTYGANKTWVEDLKKEGKTIIDIGDVPSLPSSTPDPLAMEYNQIFD